MATETKGNGNGPCNRLAGRLAESPLLARGKALFQANTQNWNLPLTKLGKLQAGAYIILHDYARGLFPPRFGSRQSAYQAEIDYARALPGQRPEEVAGFNMQKPFWNNPLMEKYLAEFCRLARSRRSRLTSIGSAASASGRSTSVLSTW